MTRTTTPLYLSLACAALLAAAPVRAEKVKTLPIVDKAIAHSGGDLYTRSETSLTIKSRSGEFRMISKVDGELFDHTVVDTTDKGIERRTRVTNTTVERTEGGKPVRLDGEGERRARDFVMARVYFPFLPYRLNDPSASKEDLGIEDWSGTKLHKVKVTFEAGTSTDANDEYLYWFEPDTGRLVQFAYSFGTGRERGGLRFRKLGNERRVGGILFADAENLGVDAGGDLKVEQITPEYVAKPMKKISDVTLSGIEVRPLAR